MSNTASSVIQNTEEGYDEMGKEPCEFHDSAEQNSPETRSVPIIEQVMSPSEPVYNV